VYLALVGISKGWPMKIERLQRLEEDGNLLALATVRAATDTGERVSLDDAAARFGIELDEFVAEDADSDEG
jgi:hypothetical protein